ncbi:MAG: hypothetical protein ABEK16_04885 [Candidatus Nanohalobium sp.]
MTEEYRELYYFLDDEFNNLGNLKDVLKGLGERESVDSSLRHIMDCYVRNSNLEYSEVKHKYGYRLENGSDAALFETDQGLFVVSNSRYIEQNSRSISSRSTKSIVK